jgi:predicted RNA-binding Zn-ribbon protein involved in translation (DUF1610 family)
MKHALNNAGQIIEASADSDASGRCPHCGAPVILRRRRNGRDGVTYFWRHQDYTKLSCPTHASITVVFGERGVQL